MRVCAEAKRFIGNWEIRWPCWLIFSRTLVKHTGNRFFPYSVPMEVKMRKAHAWLTELSEGNVFLYQMKRAPKQKETSASFLSLFVYLAVIYRRPLGARLCLRKRSKGKCLSVLSECIQPQDTVQHTSEGSVIKYTQTPIHASSALLCFAFSCNCVPHLKIFSSCHFFSSLCNRAA